MNRRGIANSWRAIAAGAAIAVLVCGLLTIYLRVPMHSLPYSDSFSSGRADEWQAFGGTWEVVRGEMRNDSDERGAKLVTGSTKWKNYVVEADVMLLGVDGDAGLTLRSSNEEEGVDSYTGYYFGLRRRGNALVIGRAEHGWTETSSNLSLDPFGVQPFRWYHLKMLAYDCQIVGEATMPASANVSSIALKDKNCIHSGRIGLRSYSSGGVWRNVTVRKADPNEMTAMMASLGRLQQAETKTPAMSEKHVVVPTASHDSTEKAISESKETFRPIADLGLFPFSNKESVTVRGVVILTSPSLIIQDATGGVSISNPDGPPLKIGDEVEASGRVRPGDFSSVLEDAKVHVLWARSPTPAVSVTASQAATGAFDANFIELEGHLRNKDLGPNNTFILDLDSGPEAFRAIVSRGRSDAFFKDVKINSLLRLRGICVADASYTENLTPFVLLLRSTDDLKILAGPPWWNAGHMVALTIGLLVAALLLNILYGRIQHWRLTAVLEERERLAHEVHDTLAQSFAGIGFQLDAIRNGVPQDLGVIHHQLDVASDLARHSHEEARRSIASLRPVSLQSGDLITALETCAHRMVEGGTVEIRTSVTGEVRILPLRMTETLYRMGQEAIANAVQHGRPRQITLSIAYENESIMLVLADDGVGFQKMGNQRGFGLQGMRRRAATIRADLHVSSEPGRGTEVMIRCALPPRLSLLSRALKFGKHLLEHQNHVQPTRQQHSNLNRG
jgi:signal transduction histidine kinase